MSRRRLRELYNPFEGLSRSPIAIAEWIPTLRRNDDQEKGLYPRFKLIACRQLLLFAAFLHCAGMTTQGTAAD
jgi:hypothetical protein